MIRFSCPTCQKTFVVADELAGRSATCKRCKGKIVVPQPVDAELVSQQAANAQAATSSTTNPSDQDSPGQDSSVRTRSKPPVRIRRLKADAEKIAAAFSNFPLITIAQTNGQPPEHYVVQYNIRGLARGASGKPVVREQHTAEIRLTLDYPRQSPQCRMLTPVFHPNIEAAAICVGDHWTAGERLVDLIIRIGEMIAYQAYNIQSPLDGEAAMWADKNAAQLPIDARDMHPPDWE